MFYVVYLCRPKVNIVVPVYWVYNYNDQWQKFVNNGLNANQKHRIFYTEDDDAWNDENAPVDGYAVDFTMAEPEEYPNTGCYHGKLVKFFLDYNDAVTFAKNRRGGEPAIYNKRRLFERPIPDLNVESELSVDQNLTENVCPNEPLLNCSDVVPILENAETTGTGASTNENKSPDLETQFDSITVCSTPALDGENDAGNVLDTDCDIKPETVLIVEPTRSTINALEDLIEETEYTVYEVDGMEIRVNNNTGFGKPFKSTTNDLMKRENDAISGNIPYNETKAGARLYKLGTYNLEVPKKVVDTFIEWNSRPEKQSAEFDQRFVHAFLLLCDDCKKASKHSIEDQQIDEFIYGFILTRAGLNNDERVQFMKQHLQVIRSELVKEGDDGTHPTATTDA